MDRSRRQPSTAIGTSSGSLLQPLQHFIRMEAAGGLVLVAAAVLALVVANSPLAVWYAAMLDLQIAIGIGTFGIAKPLLLWINDGLMAVFFLLVGMELKREVLVQQPESSDTC